MNNTYVYQTDNGMLLFGRAEAFRCRLSLTYVTGTMNNTYVYQTDNGMLLFGRAEAFRCRLSLTYVTGTMNQRDFRKMIKLIIWACEDPEVIHDALHYLELAFTHPIKLSKSAPKNMKYLQEVKSKYELQ